MEFECRCKFVVMDLGHPMNTITINNVINSLQNILALDLSLQRSVQKLNLGISILNTDFAVFLPESKLRKNFDSITKSLNTAAKSAKTNTKVTVQKFKYLLLNSFEAIFLEFQKFEKEKNQSTNSLIQMAIITRKTGSILAELLSDVINKLQTNNPGIALVQNYKVVQILNEHWKYLKGFQENKSIDWISCPDRLYDLNCFFKDWLLNPQQQLEILLSKELNFKIKCDVYDCVINPVSPKLGSKFDFFKDKPAPNLEIIYRLPIHGLCSSLMYDIRRRIYPTLSYDLEWTESQINSKIYKQLCRELFKSKQGLLAKSEKLTGKEKISSFHFLTSDGDTLLANDIAAEELFLPTGARFSEHVESSEDETAASVIKNCFEKIEVLSEYSPKLFSSGIYEYLRNYLIQEEKSKSLFGCFDPNVKLFGQNCTKAKKSPDCENPTQGNRKKRPKLKSQTKLKYIHPALLSPNSQQKYRKISSKAFNLPELSGEFNDSPT